MRRNQQSSESETVVNGSGQAVDGTMVNGRQKDEL
jgi:hypothetical protein